MKYLKLYEITDDYNDNTFYEIRGLDNNGDEYVPTYDPDDANYNPYDLREMVRLLSEKEKKDYVKNPNLYIVKVTETKVEQETIKKMIMEIEAEKFNL